MMIECFPDCRLPQIQAMSRDDDLERLAMTLPVLFEGYMMLQDIGNDDPVAYVNPVPEASSFHEAYSSFIKATETEARGRIGRDHADYLNDLNNEALAQLETWVPAAFVMKVTVDYRGDIRIVKDGTTITREDIYENAGMEVPGALHARVPKKVLEGADIASSDVKFAITFLRERLDDADERQLYQTIVERARGGGDPDFTKSFIRWLSADGGTLILRDELCRPYKSMFEDRKVEGRQNLVWDNAWTGIDSKMLAYREEFRVGSLRNGGLVETAEEEYTGPRM